MAAPRLSRDQVEGLHRAHEADVRRFLVGVLRDLDLAEEALQQTFVKVIERGHEASEGTFRGWIFRVAFHEALQLRRRRGTYGRALDRLAPEVAAAAVGPRDPADRAHDRELLDHARRAVAALPESQREVLRMRLQEGRSFAEIARALDIPLGTALTRMRLATAKLRERVPDPSKETP